MDKKYDNDYLALDDSTGKVVSAAKLLQSCQTLRPPRWQPTRLLCPQDSQGKNTAVGVCVLVAQSCPTLYDPEDCSLTGSSVHGIFLARILEWVCHFLLQGIFPTQGLNPGLLHCRRVLHLLSELIGKLL